MLLCNAKASDKDEIDSSKEDFEQDKQDLSIRSEHFTKQSCEFDKWKEEQCEEERDTIKEEICEQFPKMHNQEEI